MRFWEGEVVSLHPLVDLSVDKHVKKAAGFRASATELTGKALAVHYQDELANAPRRHEAGKKYFVAYNSRLASGRRPGRDDEHLSLALVEYCRRNEAGLALPEDTGSVDFFHAQIPLKSAAEDKAKGDADPNKGLGKIDLLGTDADGRLVVAKVKYLAPSATRGGTGDTPLRVLLEGLACSAIASVNRAALQEELSERLPRTLTDAPPILMILGSPRYWELCRKREAQKGAAWIKEMERLAKEIEDLDEAPAIVSAWEYGAGRVRPKPRPRPKTVDPADIPVEADLSLPIRSYALTESYGSGERIDHPTLGLGVVQGVAGNGKIFVLFGEKKSLLVHERPVSTG